MPQVAASTAKVVQDSGRARCAVNNAFVLVDFENGARGVLLVSNCLPGARHGLHFRIYGDKGRLEWFQEHPNELYTSSGVGEPEPILIDEALTPDSSRFWEAARYKPGEPQPSYDKQPLRDWLERSGWSKEPPAPELPPKVVEHLRDRYLEAFQRITDRQLLRPQQ